MFPHHLLVLVGLDGSAGMAEQDVPIGQLPAILRILGRHAPADRAIGGDHADLAAIVVAAQERSSG
jgi:hypothetical protein